ncbi:MAG: type I-MYXAN CRISPR-associated protein Cas6/Cmx6 [Gammaproteobacteria bacterium]|nr:type I-MYXAN CRISPR-associated protein Cas6/Cmx6 [Gammaproteobacteria bacterium]
MFWDEQRAPVYEVPEDIVDLSFRIRCAALPLDHAYSLSKQVCARLPWIGEEPGAGIHPIHGAESANGWNRPNDPDTDVLHLSKRTRLRLRLPKERVTAAQALSGATLEVAGYTINVGAATVRTLQPETTLFARHVESSDFSTEGEFLNWAVGQLETIGASVHKLVCGRTHELHTPEVALSLRSLMLADLTREESIRVQQEGLGDYRNLGCGIFVPYKGIKPVSGHETG